jgi:NAD(P)-dependent dehydrogenase (short-subunit alcohol dehydrogenase family)
VPTVRFEELTKRAGDAIQCFDCDITSRESIEAAASLVAERMGEPSVLVNNAGIDQPPTARAAVIIYTSCRSTTSAAWSKSICSARSR